MAKAPTLTERMERVEATLKLPPMRPKKTLTEWLTTKPGVVIAPLILVSVGLVIAYFAWWQPEWKADAKAKLIQDVDNEIEGKLTAHKFDQLVADVNTIKGQLSEITPLLQSVVTKEMQHAASLPLSEFERNLPQIKTTLSVAKITGAHTTPAVTQDIQTRLVRTNHLQTDFWPTAAAFISYRYPVPLKTLPNCENATVFRTSTTPIGPNQTGPIGVAGPIRVQDCLFDLSNVAHLLNEWGPATDTLECVRCVVIYTAAMCRCSTQE